MAIRTFPGKLEGHRGLMWGAGRMSGNIHFKASPRAAWEIDNDFPVAEKKKSHKDSRSWSLGSRTRRAGRVV